MPARPAPERMLLPVALAVALASGAWAGWSATRLRLPVPPRIAALSGLIYQPADLAVPEAKAAWWTGPWSQAIGPEWVYDVFTPPVIYYDPAQREFSLIPPGAADRGSGENPSPAPVGVHPAPFRLQLVGFVGGAGNYSGTFENVSTTEHFLARAGRRVPLLGLTIVDFKVERVSVDLPDRMPFAELAATAIVRDDQTGEETTLSSRERCFPGVVPGMAEPERLAGLRSARAPEGGEGAFRWVDTGPMADPDAAGETSGPAASSATELPTPRR